MRKLLLLTIFLFTTLLSIAQDTTWVQTFSFDSISTRRAEFVFPPELNTKRFEKVLMYYKLKCDPQTPWDQYNCGEWDYLAYTRVFDHTGDYDSVQVDSLRYLNNYQSTPVYDYEPYSGLRKDEYVRIEQSRSGASLTTYPVIAVGPATSSSPLNVSQAGSNYQMLISATELSNAGVVAGDIESLSLFVSSLTTGGQLYYPSISIKATMDNNITNFHKTGFTEVYNASRYGGSELVVGENEFLFYQPFTWNGTDNLVIELSRTAGDGGQTNLLEFEMENSAADLAIAYPNKNGVMDFDGSNQALLELSDYDLGDDITIAFWAKGSGNTGANTSILEGYDTLNNRVINIHFPWSNNRLYWDCGEGSGYDRIDADMSAAGIDNEWHHWVFVKDQAAGEMKVFRDGVLWHSGTGLTRSIGELHRLVIGANRSLANHWSGRIDEFQLFNTALSDATISAWYDQKVTVAHPNWSDLLVYYSFDNTSTAEDGSLNDFLLMPSTKGMIDFSEYPLTQPDAENRPRISFGQGIVNGSASTTEEPYYVTKEPEVVFEFAQVDHHFEIVNAFLATPEGSEDVYDATMTVVSSVSFSGSNTLNNSTITYYEAPFEIIHDVEIGRFITPYGISFNLGPNGFTWIYDVTDYQMYLKDTVDIAAHNTQELIDLKFAFIEGIPTRDVHSRIPVWSDWKSYKYGDMDNDNVLGAVQVQLPDTSSMFKIKTRFTGHGHEGNTNMQHCCEWDSKDHMISVDGVERFNWEIWEETACGDNPNVSQGGTWPYAREGWCPGDLVKEYDHELTPYVTPGSTVTLDYDIEDVPTNNQGQANGNYVVAMDMIAYSEPNHQYDVALIDVLNPNSWEYYRKWNPSCQNPRVIIQNTGEQTLTNVQVEVWIDPNNSVTYDWTGNLEFLEKEIIEIPIPMTTFWYDYNSAGTFTARVNLANDEYAQNDEIKLPYTAPAFIDGPFLVWFNTNNRAFENKWRLEDSHGNVVFERTSLTNSTTYKDTFDLAPGCYSIILEDSDNDGISFWYSQQVEGESAGAFRIKKVGGVFIENFEPDFGNYNRFNFSVGFDLGIEEIGDIEEEILIFPNPNNGLFDVEIVGNVHHEAYLEIFDIMGRKVFGGAMNAKVDFANAKIDLTDLPAGHFIVKVKTPVGVYTEEFIKR